MPFRTPLSSNSLMPRIEIITSAMTLYTKILFRVLVVFLRRLKSLILRMEYSKSRSINILCSVYTSRHKSAPRFPYGEGASIDEKNSFYLQISELVYTERTKSRSLRSLVRTGTRFVDVLNQVCQISHRISSRRQIIWMRAFRTNPRLIRDVIEIGSVVAKHGDRGVIKGGNKESIDGNAEDKDQQPPEVIRPGAEVL